jgi:CHRD domain
VRRRRLQFAVLVAVMGLLGVAAAAVAGGGGRDVRERLTGYEETPMTLSTTGIGHFRAKVKNSAIEYRLTYSGLEGDVTQSHIHLGAEGTTGGISVFLCRTTQTAPAGTPTCPGPRAGTVSGTIEPADVIGPAGQGINPGEYAKLLRAIRAGATYANVHSSKYPTGEIRAQLDEHRDHH